MIGQAWARVPALALGIWLAWKAFRRGVRHHRRTAAYRRWAQALSPVLAQGAGQHEQVLAGLAGTARAERVTAPHYGAAPNAAWSLRITRWDHDQVAGFVLRLPAHDDITTPDFLAKIKDAVHRKTGAHIRLHVNPQRDEISGEVTDGSEEPKDQATARDLAIERITLAASMLLKGVRVEHLDMDEPAAGVPAPDGIAGAGHPLREFTISFEPARVVTSASNRFNITAHMSTQLFGEPDRLRHTWEVDRDRVTFRRRREFPFLIPAPVLTVEELRQMFGDRVVLTYGEDEDGELAGYALAKTTLPHGGVIGPTGGGKTQLLLLLAIRAAFLGVEVWGCDPKMIELMGLRGWPNVTRVATRIQDMIKLVADAHALMYERIEDVAAGRIRKSELRRLLVIIDEFFVFRMLVSAWWAATRKKDDAKEHPVFRQIAELLALSRGLNMNIVVGIQRPDAVFFGEGSRDNIGWWVSLGSLSPQGAQMVWQDSHIGTDLPIDVPGLCTATTAKGPARVKVHYVPNPADALTGDGLSDEDMAFLRALLPPGTTWDGPLPATAPDPGFEASAAAEEAIAADPVTGFLLLVQLALSSRTAHLTAVPGGGAPASGDLGGRYGWGAGPGGQPEPGGTWIGAVEDTAAGRRVYLHPVRAYQAAADYAAELDEPFVTRSQLDEALRNSGLLLTEQTKTGTRYTVRRDVPGNDLGDARLRVWDIPEDALIGTPAAPGAADPEPPAAGPGAAAGTLPAGLAAPVRSAPAVPQFRRASDLADGDRIILDFESGERLTATVLGSPQPDPTTAGHPEPDGMPRLILNYFLGSGDEIGQVQARADHPIRLEPPTTAEGSQP